MGEHAGEIGAPSRVAPMFGQDDNTLLGLLEVLRKRLCCYWGERCDCKFGATGQGEQTGCPEVRQAIAIISGQREQVIVLSRALEDSAVNTLNEVRRLLDRHAPGPVAHEDPSDD